MLARCVYWCWCTTDISALVHTGSPFHFNIEGDPFKLINPAVNGTTNVLKSALAHGKQLKRIVVTSSVAAVQDPSKPAGTVYNVDKDWNESDPKKVQQDPKSVNGSEAYMASKSLAEKAAWDLVRSSGTGVDLATVNPALVIGPIIHQVSGPDSLNTSSGQFYEFFQGKFNDEATFSQGVFAAADVRDVAWLHIRALEQESAANNRWPAVWGPFSYQLAADKVHAGDYPASVKERILVGKPGTNDVSKVSYTDGHKAEKLLGRPVLDFGEQLHATYQSYADYEKRNWKGQPDLALLDL